MINKDSNNNKDIKKEPVNWYLVDAKDQILGRLSSFLATRLMGKHKVSYSDNTCLKDKIIVSSFDWRTLTEIKNQYPEISRAYLTYQQVRGMKIKKTIYNRSPWMSFLPFYEDHELPKIIKKQGGKAWHPYYKDINKKIVDISHQEGLPVNVWTVNKEYDFLKMVEYGVDGIMTDYPLRLKEFCEKKNINWF